MSVCRAVIFDFDGTLSATAWIPRLQTHAVADRRAVFAAMDGGEGGTWASLFAEWVADLLASKRPSMMPPNGRSAQLGWPASKGDNL